MICAIIQNRWSWFVLALFTEALFFFPVTAHAGDLEIYGEHSAWAVAASDNSERTTFNDASLLRLRLLAGNHRDVIRPYLTLAVARDRLLLGRDDRSEVGLLRSGGGFRFSQENSPIDLYIEARHVNEQRSPKDEKRFFNEVVAIPVIAGATPQFSDDIFARASWYADLNHVMTYGSDDLDAGSAWFRVSTAQIKGYLTFTLEPVDVSAYRECYQGCRGWFFAGVGATVAYSSSSLSMSLRGTLGERVDHRSDQKMRSTDAARIQLMVQGGF